MTELELCILGVIGREEPVTAYGVRAHFASSPTVTWSSSAGSVYPAIVRLRRAGLIVAGLPTDRRKSQMLSLTADGKAALRRWLLDSGDAAGAPAADPIRTRVQFLSLLGPIERFRAIERYKEDTQTALDQARSAQPSTNEVEELARTGIMFELQARRDWLALLAEKWLPDR